MVDKTAVVRGGEAPALKENMLDLYANREVRAFKELDGDYNQSLYDFMSL